MIEDYRPTTEDWAEYSVYCSELDEREYHLSTCKAGCYCPICEAEREGK